MTENRSNKKVRLVTPLSALYFSQIGNYFRDKRLERGMTQEEISRFLGYNSKQIVSNWERGICNPPMDIIGKLIKVLDLDSEEVLNLFMNITRKELTERFSLETLSKEKKAS
jgi:transcriptional regulator with XRE-family HTH domain